MKQRLIRLAAGLDPDDVVVRGGELDPVVLRDDALRNHSIYGCFGLSVFSARGITIDELAQRPPLVRFEVLILVTVAELRSLGLRLEATGRNPRHYDITFDELEAGVAALCSCERRIVINPYYEH